MSVWLDMFVVYWHWVCRWRSVQSNNRARTLGWIIAALNKRNIIVYHCFQRDYVAFLSVFKSKSHLSENRGFPPGIWVLCRTYGDSAMLQLVGCSQRQVRVHAYEIKRVQHIKKQVRGRVIEAYTWVSHERPMTQLEYSISVCLSHKMSLYHVFRH